MAAGAGYCILDSLMVIVLMLLQMNLPIACPLPLSPTVDIILSISPLLLRSRTCKPKSCYMCCRRLPGGCPKYTSLCRIRVDATSGMVRVGFFHDALYRW